MDGTIVTSVNFLSVSGNRSSPCPRSLTSSTRFRLADLTAFTEISESIISFPVFLTLSHLLPSVIFSSLMLSITVFYRIVPFWVLDRYTTSLLPSYCVGFLGKLFSLSSVAESINNSLNLHSHSSNLSRITPISSPLRPVFNVEWVP